MADLSNYSTPPSRPPSSGGCCAVVLALLALLIGGAVLVGMVALVLWPMIERPGEERHSAVGKRLSRLELVGLTDGARSLTLDELSGKVVLLNFWGTWCPPCRMEMPHLAGLHREFRTREDFRFLPVSYPRGLGRDVEQLRRDVEAFLAQENLDLPAYADPDSVTVNAFDQAGRFEGFPTTVLLDRQGVIRAVWTGFDPGTADETIAEMRRQIERLLD